MTEQTFFITVDAVTAGHLGQYGYRRNTMPVLDELTADGAKFENAYANGPYSAVSIPSFLTSRYLPSRAANAPTIGEVLQAADVETAAFHSNVLLENEFGRMPGFDTYENFDIADEKESREDDDPATTRIYKRCVDVLKPYLGSSDIVRSLHERIAPKSHLHSPTVYVDAAETTDSVLSWVEENGNEDSFVWVHYMDPHRPYGIAPETPYYASKDPDREEILSLMQKAGTSPESVTASEHERLIDLYDSDLRYTSRQLSRLFDGLRERGIWSDANVFLTADHGEEFREHGMYFHRNKPYEELVHVPLFAKHPGLDGPRADRRELLDIGPTMCDIYSIDPPKQFLGKSMFTETPDRDVVATGSISGNKRIVTIRRGRWKLFATESNPLELYDLATDSGEQNSVMEDEPRTAAELANEIPVGLYESDEQGDFETQSGDVQQRLADLGYLD